MKNAMKVLCIVAAFAFAAPINAQKFGLKFGVNFSTVEYKQPNLPATLDVSMKPGFHFGLVTEFKVAKGWAIGTGLVFSVKGFDAKLTETVNNQKFDYSVRTSLSYLEMPLLIKPSMEIGKARLYGNVGVNLGYGSGGYIRDLDNEIFGSFSLVDRVKWGGEDGLQQWDLGGVLGIGIRQGSWNFEINYDMGLPNIAAKNKPDVTLKNRVLEISLGYMFGKKHKDRSIKR